ncbi:MAG: CBS domain-containing protein [Gammaproteobacteria bacterium]|jgi:CBS domain-containing protein
MTAGKYCNRDVVIVEATDSLRETIQLMRKNHVGDIVVVEQTNGVNTPVGILTDRDLVIEVLAQDVDIDSVTVGDVMSDQLVSVTDNTSLDDTLDVMRTHGIRRLPVIDHSGNLQGIITLDDVLEVLADQIQKLAILVKMEQRREKQLRN